MQPTIVLWRRLDTTGLDACRFAGSESAWRIDGTAVLRHEGAPASLSYEVECDPAWRTRRGVVRGFVGTQPIELSIERTAGGKWTLDGQAVSGLETCEHLDFAFTPATNVPQIRRLALAVGQAADCPVAWLDVPRGALELLPQRYERRSASAFWYEAPTVGYAGLLELTPLGIVRRYPGLWELVD